MDKYIKESDLFKRILNVDFKHDYDGFIKFCQSIPAADVQEVLHGRWVPVTERLPEEDIHCVLVTYKDGNDYFVKQMYYGKAYFECSSKICFYDNDSEYGDIEYRGVIAWMPLPDPYKEV